MQIDVQLNTFYARLTQLLPEDSGCAKSIVVYLQSIFVEFGWPMLIGSLPWALAGSWIGYRWSLRLVTGLRRRSLKRHPTANK